MGPASHSLGAKTLDCPDGAGRHREWKSGLVVPGNQTGRESLVSVWALLFCNYCPSLSVVYTGTFCCAFPDVDSPPKLDDRRLRAGHLVVSHKILDIMTEGVADVFSITVDRRPGQRSHTSWQLCKDVYVSRTCAHWALFDLPLRLTFSLPRT